MMELFHAYVTSPHTLWTIGSLLGDSHSSDVMETKGSSVSLTEASQGNQIEKLNREGFL
jgi:hypothetical protein